MTETFLLVFIAMVTLLNIASALYIRAKVQGLAGSVDMLLRLIVRQMEVEDA